MQLDSSDNVYRANQLEDSWNRVRKISQCRLSPDLPQAEDSIKQLADKVMSGERIKQPSKKKHLAADSDGDVAMNKVDEPAQVLSLLGLTEDDSEAEVDPKARQTAKVCRGGPGGSRTVDGKRRNRGQAQPPSRPGGTPSGVAGGSSDDDKDGRAGPTARHGKAAAPKRPRRNSQETINELLAKCQAKVQEFESVDVDVGRMKLSPLYNLLRDVEKRVTSRAEFAEDALALSGNATAAELRRQLAAVERQLRCGHQLLKLHLTRSSRHQPDKDATCNDLVKAIFDCWLEKLAVAKAARLPWNRQQFGGTVQGESGCSSQ